MIRYWTAIADEHPDEWADIETGDTRAFSYKLLELTGFIAWSLAAADIIGPSFLTPEEITVNWDSVQLKIQRLSGRIDWRRHRRVPGHDW